MSLMYHVDGEDYSACYYDDFRGRHGAWLCVLDGAAPWALSLMGGLIGARTDN